mmetsp:Transcript_17981/g.34605  ORF Transcript_17981/g.34605 Transcript_17981/m.34605 type:complete len:84 (-) Transcript_17981:37-288(-)
MLLAISCACSEETTLRPTVNLTTSLAGIAGGGVEEETTRGGVKEENVEAGGGTLGSSCVKPTGKNAKNTMKKLTTSCMAMVLL